MNRFTNTVSGLALAGAVLSGAAPGQACAALIERLMGGGL